MTTLSFAQSNPLVGSWHLTHADKILPDGKQVADYGENPQGIAIFTADGHYAVEIFRGERQKFLSGDKLKGTPEEYKDAVLSTSCHFGTYSIDEANGMIIFNTDRSSYPNWDNTKRKVTFHIKDDELSWQQSPRPDGSMPVSVFRRNL
ncbi:Lipocalin-like domain-containing protein [Chitinophaga sancti]|nr:Lipocalin-like domain-containing protein [Chitinophaga sancti]